MKIVHVVPHVAEEASGPSYSVTRQCEGLAARGHDVEMSCIKAGRPLAGVKVDTHPQWSILSGFAVSTSHARALGPKADGADIVHNHSLWSMVNVATGLIVPGRKARLVTSPHGTLAPAALARSSRAKTLLWPLQRRVLSEATLLQATSEEERRQIRAAGFGAPVAVIPNGIDVPPLNRSTCRGSRRMLLFLGRLHPIKGIDRLLDAWSGLEQRHPDWDLVISGPGEADFVAGLRNRIDRLQIRRATLSGAVYGEAKQQAYQDADLFVLPTHTENFGIAVAEALASGCPALVSRGAPWAGLETQGCGFWVHNDVPALTLALDHALAMPPAALEAMGARGRDWMARDFGWDGLSAQLEAAYLFALGRGPRPDCVEV